MEEGYALLLSALLLLPCARLSARNTPLKLDHGSYGLGTRSLPCRWVVLSAMYSSRTQLTTASTREGMVLPL
jgi:hypothetical protein